MFVSHYQGVTPPDLFRKKKKKKVVKVLDGQVRSRCAVFWQKGTHFRISEKV